MGASSLSLDDSPAVQLAGKVTMFAVLVLFFVLLCLHLYAKRYYSNNMLENPTSSSAEAPKLRGGLEASVIDSLTLIVVGGESEEGLECAVCLSDVVEGDKARLLPKCEHKFHVECIDMWFKSHSTCPLCRSSVVVEPSLASGFLSESPVFPTNVLFWGDHTRVSSGGPGNASSSSDARQEGMLAIGIVPSEESGMVAVASGSRSSLGNGGVGGGEEELKSPVVATRLRSLKRLLSRDRRAVNSCSPSAAAVDIEEGRT